MAWRRLISRDEDSEESIDKIHENFISATFTLVGTTQGLAIGALAQNTTAVIQYEISWKACFIILQCLVCFFVIARVTQTYICGALSYVQKMFSTTDLFSILIVGWAQYWVIDALQKSTSFGLLPRVGTLAAIAAGLHSYVLWRLYHHGKREYEKTIQYINIAAALSILLHACFRFISRAIHTQA